MDDIGAATSRPKLVRPRVQRGVRAGLILAVRVEFDFGPMSLDNRTFPELL